MEGSSVPFDDAIYRLLHIRNMWPLLTSKLKQPKYQDILFIGDILDYSAKLWLLDAFFNAYDYHNRIQIKARIAVSKYPDKISKEKVKEEVLERLILIEHTLDKFGNEPDIALLSAQGKEIAKIRNSASTYFTTHQFFSNVPNTELEGLLNRLSFLLADEDIFISS